MRTEATKGAVKNSSRIYPLGGKCTSTQSIKDSDWSAAARECRRRYQREYWERRAKKEGVEQFDIIESIYNIPEPTTPHEETIAEANRRLSAENIKLSQKLFTYEQFMKRIGAITKDAAAINEKF